MGLNAVKAGGALPIHLFRHFCCGQWAVLFSHNVERHGQMDGQTVLSCQLPMRYDWLKMIITKIRQ